MRHGKSIISALIIGFAPPAPLALAAGEGETIYGDYCSVCHGDRGDGQSRARNSMVPPPRDFTTPAASIELTRERMLNAVAHGRPGTAMAPWENQLDAPQIESVVDFIRKRFMLPAATPDAERGRRIYAENCSVCHGDDGQGAVWTAASMSPPPRNFASDTARRDLTRERMIASVTYGRADTAMPGFGTQLGPEDIVAVVDYVRFAFLRTPAGPEEDTDAHPTTAMDAGFAEGLAGNAQRGRAFYLANCATCHGVEGDGKGPRAYFILPKPRNFRHAASRNRLNRPALFEAIARGRLRTEMPAWDKVLDSQEIADVAEYVFQAFISPDEAAH